MKYDVELTAIVNGSQAAYVIAESVVAASPEEAALKVRQQAEKCGPGYGWFLQEDDEPLDENDDIKIEISHTVTVSQRHVFIIYV